MHLYSASGLLLHCIMATSGRLFFLFTAASCYAVSCGGYQVVDCHKHASLHRLWPLIDGPFTAVTHSLVVPAAVQLTVANGLAQVGACYRFAVAQVCDGARHLEDAVIGARGELQSLHGALQEQMVGVIQAAGLFNLLVCETAV